MAKKGTGTKAGGAAATSAQAAQAAAGADTTLGAISAQLASLSEQLSKGTVDSKSITDTLASLKSITQVTDYMGEEIAGLQGLDDAMVGKTNRKIILDDAYFDLSVARKQLLRSIEQSIQNTNNQYGQNNAMTLNGVDKLQNDVEDTVKLSAVLDRLAADLKVLQASLASK